MKKSWWYLIALAVLTLLPIQQAAAQCVATADGTGIKVVDLIAGQNQLAGTIAIEVVGNNLVVTYNTTGCWELVEAHLWVGSSLADMPQTNKGNPKVGNFPYQSGDITGQTEYNFNVSLNLLNFSCDEDDESDDTTYFVAAHAAVRCADGTGGYTGETAWGDGRRFVDKGNWGTYSTITLTCDCNGTGGPGEDCETAFAYNGDDPGTCFLQIDLDGDGEGDFNRWGWTIGPLAESDETRYYDIYAGAGQCDITKGTRVGKLMVSYFDGVASVVYMLDLDNEWLITEVHTYVGNNILPQKSGNYTVAPGQYPHQAKSASGIKTTVAYVVEDLSGDIYVVAHAVVCKEADE